MGEDLRERFSTLHEIVRAGHQTLDPGAWDYLAGGAETETRLRRNRQALASMALRPRVLRDVSNVRTTATRRSVRRLTAPCTAGASATWPSATSSRGGPGPPVWTSRPRSRGTR